MEQWKEYKLGDISNMKYGKLPQSKITVHIQFGLDIEM